MGLCGGVREAPRPRCRADAYSPSAFSHIASTFLLIRFESRSSSAARRWSSFSTADGLRAIAEAVSEEGGKDAMVQRLADKYVSELAEMAKQSNLVIVPDRPNDISGVVATAMGMFDQVKQNSTSGAH